MQNYYYKTKKKKNQTHTHETTHQQGLVSPRLTRPCHCSHQFRATTTQLMTPLTLATKALRLSTPRSAFCRGGALRILFPPLAPTMPLGPKNASVSSSNSSLTFFIYFIKNNKIEIAKIKQNKKEIKKLFFFFRFENRRLHARSSLLFVWAGAFGHHIFRG